MTKSIILLSGGLDSLVSLGLCKEEYNIELAITFDYGQKSAKSEIASSELICKFYNVQHKIIVLDWLKDITHTALVSEKDIQEDELRDLVTMKPLKEQKPKTVKTEENKTEEN